MKIDVRGHPIIPFIAVILKHLLLFLLTLQLALTRPLLFLLILLHLLHLTIDLRDLSLESHEQAASPSSSILVGGGGTTPRISELLEGGCRFVLLLAQCQLPIPNI